MEMIETMDKNRRLVHNDIASLVFYMQGGVEINDAYNLSIDQRRMMQKVIEKHYEAQNGGKNSRLI